jgi:hypothetical protein
MADLIDGSVLSSDFVRDLAPQPLRVCCYGSSSSGTPSPYLREAAALGYILAKRGHTCVNGAGSFGCMSAMNHGADYGGGKIVGVIHEMWLIDGASAASKNVRDGGAHPVFDDEKKNHEMLIAKGNDLQERKRLLVENANALVVLPGGPGTWDELWEMACAVGLGLSSLPIVCVNVDGYYDPFRTILERAYREQLMKVPPEQIVHFETTAESAVRWIETAQEKYTKPRVTIQARSETLRRSSVLHNPITGSNNKGSRENSSLFRSYSQISSIFAVDEPSSDGYSSAFVFVAGMTTGALLSYIHLTFVKRK